MRRPRRDLLAVDRQAPLRSAELDRRASGNSPASSICASGSCTHFWITAFKGRAHGRIVALSASHCRPWLETEPDLAVSRSPVQALELDVAISLIPRAAIEEDDFVDASGTRPEMPAHDAHYSFSTVFVSSPSED